MDSDSPSPSPAPAARRIAIGARLRRLALNTDQFRVLVGIVLIITVSKIHMILPAAIGRLRPALTLTSLTLLYAIMNPRFLVTGNIFRRFPARVIAGLAIVACLSVPLSISMGASGSFILSEFSKTIVFAFLLIAAIRDARDLYTMIWSLAISGGALAYIGIFVLRMRVEGQNGIERIQEGLSYDSNDMGLVCVVTLVFVLLVFQVSSSKGKAIALVLLAALGATIARTGSRGTFVAMGVMGLGMLILVRSVSIVKKALVVVVASAAIAIAAPPGYWDQMLTILAPEDDYNWTSETGRKELVLRGIGYMMSNPLTGIGVANFGRAEGTISDAGAAKLSGLSDQGVKWSAAHNTYVQAGAEMGVPGLILMVLLVFGGAVSTMKLRRRIPARWARGDAEERFLCDVAEFLPVAFFAFGIGCGFVSFAYLDLAYVLGAIQTGLYTAVEVKLAQQARVVGVTGDPSLAAAPPQRIGRGGLSWLPPSLSPPAGPVPPPC